MRSRRTPTPPSGRSASRGASSSTTASRLTIDDVLYTFNRIVKNNFSGASGIAYMDLKSVRKRDAYTVSIPMAERVLDHALHAGR